MKSHTEIQGVAGDDVPLKNTISGSRGAMVGGHKKSAAPLDNPDYPLHFTGQSREYAKYVFNNVVGNDGSVLSFLDVNGRKHAAIIKRSSGTLSGDVISQVIFYQRLSSENGVPYIDAIEIDSYTKHDNVFSSKLTPTSKLNNLSAGDVLHKDEELTRVPSQVGKEFCDGVNLLTTTMSHPDIIEDSYLISDRAAEKMHAYGLKRFFISLRDNEYLLNTYGTPENPKYYPCVGEAVRDDGLVIAVRKHDPLFAALDMSIADTMEHSTYYDSCYHVDADPKHVGNRENSETGSRVVDLRVWRNEASISQDREGERNKIRSTDENIRLLDESAKGLKHYYSQIVQFYLHHLKVSHGKVQFSPEATRIICEAMASEAHNYRREFDKARYGRDSHLTAVERIYQYSPISHYSIEIVVRYPIPVTVSSKITDLSGTKGIVGAVRPLHQMPRDPVTGEYIDVVRSSNAVMRRSTYAGLYHIYWDAASLQLRDKLNEMRTFNTMGAFDVLCDYLSKYNERWAEVIRLAHPTEEKVRKLFDQIDQIGTRIQLPHELDKTPVEITKAVRENYAPRKTRLEITNYFGERELTKEEFYYGNVYTLRLDKTGREFSSTSSMRTNYLGMISVSLPNTRDSRPVNDKPIKYGGESERRLITAYGRPLFDTIHYRANNPDAHYGIVLGLYESNTPAAPGDLLGVGDKPCGLSNAHKLTMHPMFCEGAAFVRPEKES